MKKQLFEYAVLYHSKTKDSVPPASVNYNTEIIISPTTALAKSEKDLIFKITREIPEKYVDESDNIQIIVRNF